MAEAKPAEGATAVDANDASRQAFMAWVAHVPLHERTPWQVWQAAIAFTDPARNVLWMAHGE